MFYSSVLFLLTLTAQQVFKSQLASTELLTILGGLISSLLFLFALTVSGLLPSLHDAPRCENAEDFDVDARG